MKRRLKCGVSHLGLLLLLKHEEEVNAVSPALKLPEDRQIRLLHKNRVKHFFFIDELKFLPVSTRLKRISFDGTSE